MAGRKGIRPIWIGPVALLYGVAAATVGTLVFHQDDWLARALLWAAGAGVLWGLMAWRGPSIRRDQAEAERIRRTAQDEESQRRAADQDRVLRERRSARGGRDAQP